jgi:elongation factor Ts
VYKRQGLIYSYIHTGSKLGILIEVNCETDFVARREEFSDVAKNIAMQIASNPEITVVSAEDIPASVKEEAMRFESAKDDLKNKPEEIRNKIVEGRVDKTLKKQVLLEQEYIRDSNLTVNEYIKQVVGILGENIKVARFTRFVLGETNN